MQSISYRLCKTLLQDFLFTLFYYLTTYLYTYFSITTSQDTCFYGSQGAHISKVTGMDKHHKMYLDTCLSYKTEHLRPLLGVMQSACGCPRAALYSEHAALQRDIHVVLD